MSDKGIHIFEEVQKTITDVIGDVFCPGRYYARQKCVHVQTRTESGKNCFECPQCKACGYGLKNRLKDRGSTIKLFSEGTFCIAKRTSRD